jgi:hypothetical protein
MTHSNPTRSQRVHVRLRGLLSLGAAAAVAAALAQPAAADRAYHSQHLKLTPLGAAPLRSGFVENIKASGPQVYAHEIFVLKGAVPQAAYTVTRHFFPFDPGCGGGLDFASALAELETNANGNARGDLFVRPEEVAGFEGVHGVMWTVQNAAGAVAYRTRCTAVTLD